MCSLSSFQTALPSDTAGSPYRAVLASEALQGPQGAGQRTFLLAVPDLLEKHGHPFSPSQLGQEGDRIENGISVVLTLLIQWERTAGGPGGSVKLPNLSGC